MCRCRLSRCTVLCEVGLSLCCIGSDVGESEEEEEEEEDEEEEEEKEVGGETGEGAVTTEEGFSGVAAAAEQFQPKGITLATTEVIPDSLSLSVNNFSECWDAICTDWVWPISPTVFLVAGAKHYLYMYYGLHCLYISNSFHKSSIHIKLICPFCSLRTNC